MRFSFSAAVFVWSLALADAMRAQDALVQPAPLSQAVTGVSAGRALVEQARGQRALEQGFPAAAAEILRTLVGVPEVDQRVVTQLLAAALIDDNRAAEAMTMLDNFNGPRGAAWHLYRGLAAIQLRRLDAARAEVAEVAAREGELTPEERSWWFYLQASVAERGDDRRIAAERAKAFYQQAIDAATSLFARVRFEIAHGQALLQIGAPTPQEMESFRATMETNRGREAGFGAARTYAVGLNAQNRRSDAVAVLQRLLLELPAQERGREADLLLLLGMIAGAEEGTGRNALLRLLANGRDVDRQRIALQLLAEKSGQEPARSQLRAELTRFITQPTPHPILAELLLFRANFALAEKNFALAEEDAKALLEKFPGSSLRAFALEVLTRSAWEQRRYRTVVDYAIRAAEAQSAESPAGRQMRAELNVLVAEAWFRAGDFRNAADAYDVVLRNPPAGAAVGRLMFQRVQSEIEAGSPEAAPKILDELARDPAFDAESRWHAEWNVAQALLARGTAEAATVADTRIGQLLRESPAGLSAELRAKMSWLQAKLAFTTGDAQRTLDVVSNVLPPRLEGLEPGLKTEIASEATLLRAEAGFALNDEAGAVATLKKLRADFPRSTATVQSYLAEANYYSARERTVEAQRLYTQFVDEFPNDRYAPYALYLAALQAARRGQNLAEANQRIEDLVTKYPNSPLVFEARLKQGELLRTMNDSPAAQRVYDDLVNRFAANPDVVRAQLALADCHNTMATGDPAHAASALALYEHVRDRVDAPVDVRVEAGYKRGLMLAQRGEPEKATAAWWLDVVTAFLDDPAAAAKLGAKGRYWMGRTLLEYGTLREQQLKVEEAKQAWLKIIDAKLSDEATTRARAYLAHYGVVREAKP